MEVLDFSLSSTPSRRDWLVVFATDGVTPRPPRGTMSSSLVGETDIRFGLASYSFVFQITQTWFLLDENPPALVFSKGISGR